MIHFTQTMAHNQINCERNPVGAGGIIALEFGPAKLTKCENSLKTHTYVAITVSNITFPPPV